MTYLATRIRRNARVRPRSLGDTFTDMVNAIPATLGIEPSSPSDATLPLIAALKANGTITDDTTQEDCLAAANASVASLDAKWYAISKTWNPVGNFSPADMNTVIATTMEGLTNAKIAVTLSPHNTGDAADTINQAVSEVDRWLNAVQPYLQALVNAKAANATVVKAPGFKTWVIQSMIAMSSAYVVRSVQECNVTWLNTVSDYFDKIIAVAMRVVDIAIKAGDVALDVVGDTLDAYKYVKWAAVGVGAWLLIQWMKKAKA